MKNFLKKIICAIRDSSFYREAKNHTTGNAIWYLVRLILVSAFIATTVITLRNHGFISKDDLREMAGAYPTELEIRIDNGDISSNVTSPYFINFTESETEELQHFIAIDTESNFSPSRLESYKSIVLISRDGVGMVDRGQVRFINAEILGNRVIDANVISTWLHKGEKYLWIAIILIFLFIWLFNLIAYGGYLLETFLVALLVMLIGKIKGTKLSYKEGLRIALYAVTLPILLDIILLGFRDIQSVRTILGFPFFSEMVWLAVIILKLPDSRADQKS